MGMMTCPLARPTAGSTPREDLVEALVVPTVPPLASVPHFGPRRPVEVINDRLVLRREYFPPTLPVLVVVGVRLLL